MAVVRASKPHAAAPVKSAARRTAYGSEGSGHASTLLRRSHVPRLSRAMRRLRRGSYFNREQVAPAARLAGALTCKAQADRPVPRGLHPLHRQRVRAGPGRGRLARLAWPAARPLAQGAEPLRLPVAPRAPDPPQVRPEPVACLALEADLPAALHQSAARLCLRRCVKSPSRESAPHRHSGPPRLKRPGRKVELRLRPNDAAAAGSSDKPTDQSAPGWPIRSSPWRSRGVAPIDFHAGDVAIRVEAVPQHGMATIWDADVLIWAASQIVEARDRGAKPCRGFQRATRTRRKVGVATISER